MTTDDPTTRTTTAEDLRGSVQQSLADLAKVAEALPEAGSPPPNAARVLTQLSGELAEAAAMVRALPGRPADDPAATAPAVPLLGSTAVRALLTALGSALDIPLPAGPDDEVTFLRLRSERAAEANRAILRVLCDRAATDLDLAWTGAWLDEAMRQYPADAYEHSAMTL
jgi:hypothetical protein